MEDPTSSDSLPFAEFVEFVNKQIEAGRDVDFIISQKEFIAFNESIQRGGLKSASSPSYFIMTINMNSPASGKGIAEKRRKLLSIIMRSFFSDIIFCQELPGYFEQNVVSECGTLGYEYVKNGKESAVLWRTEYFNGSTEGLETTNSRITKLRDSLLPDSSELLSRIAMVKLTSRVATKAPAVLAVSWHGSYKLEEEAKKRQFQSLNNFLTKVIEKKKINSYIIGGDFNLNTLEAGLPRDVVVAGYDLSPRQTKAQTASSRYIPYKDNFVAYPRQKVRVSWIRPFHFEDKKTAYSDMSQEDQAKAKQALEKGTAATATPPEMTDMLDHDPIVAVMDFPSTAAVQNLTKKFKTMATK